MLDLKLKVAEQLQRARRDFRRELRARPLQEERSKRVITPARIAIGENQCRWRHSAVNMAVLVASQAAEDFALGIL
jgi:hypothetical protein